MDRRETVEIFRERLAEVIDRSGLTRSAFAAQLDLDRSTLSQLLSGANVRLPRADTIAAIASSQQVSVDWLLGLSQEGQLTADIIGRDTEISPGVGLPGDERLRGWNAEAIGYKIRYVPTTLPDLFKTETVLEYEYRAQGTGVPRARQDMAEKRLAYSRRPETDMEVCTSVHSIQAFARGEGMWRGLPASDRREQLAVMIDLAKELYPTFRWFLFDGLKDYCVPVTIFGPKRAAIYFGGMYVVFNSTEHLRAMIQHFDDLIRQAVVQPNEIPDFLRGLLRELDESGAS